MPGRASCAVRESRTGEAPAPHVDSGRVAGGRLRLGLPSDGHGNDEHRPFLAEAPGDHRLRGRPGDVHPRLERVPATRAVARAALGSLGIGAPVTIAGGTATVDLAKATNDQVAEIVYTLTQFPSVQRVDVAGRTGLTRDDFAAYVPPILVETPAPGAEVHETFHVSGTASVFEATLVVQLVRQGKVISKRTVTASRARRPEAPSTRRSLPPRERWSSPPSRRPRPTGRPSTRSTSRSRSRLDRPKAVATMPAAERSPVAQLAEHPAVNRRVVGSSPTRGARLFFAHATVRSGG